MQSERRFEQAVQLAAAFVSNGDIRLRGSTRSNSDACLMLEDLIPTLYEMLTKAHSRCAEMDFTGGSA